MKFAVGKKINMTKIFDEQGVAHSGTLICFENNTIISIKDTEKDGYKAVQIGYGEKKEKNIHKAEKGQMKKLGNFAGLKEFRVEDTSNYKEGEKIDVANFVVGEKVNVSAISKGKGFQGVVKRHGFGGGRRSHGQKHSEREPGAIGGGARAGGRVAKGLRMAGRMGGERVTLKNLKILAIDKDNSVLMISGGIPGKRGTLIEVVAK